MFSWGLVGLGDIWMNREREDVSRGDRRVGLSRLSGVVGLDDEALEASPGARRPAVGAGVTCPERYGKWQAVYDRYRRWIRL